ncbi:MAG: hypothetical protein AAB593_00790 [Patescibacteria group bacterium]
MANIYKKLFIITFITFLSLSSFNFTQAMHCGLAFNNLSCATKLPSEQSAHCKSCFNSNNAFYACVDIKVNCPLADTFGNKTSESDSDVFQNNDSGPKNAIDKAERLGTTLGGVRNAPTSIGGIFDILLVVMSWIFRFAIAIGIIMIIISGLMYILSGGNSERASKAIKLLLYTIIGIIIVALSWSIINIIRNLL